MNMGEVKTLMLAYEHETGLEFKEQPEEQIVALWKADRNIKIIGSLLQIHISNSPIEDCSAMAEITLEPRISMDPYIGGEKSERTRVINHYFFHQQVLTSGHHMGPPPNIVMFPPGEYISVAKDTTIHLIDKASISGRKGTTIALVYFVEK